MSYSFELQSECYIYIGPDLNIKSAWYQISKHITQAALFACLYCTATYMVTFVLCAGRNLDDTIINFL